MIETVIGFVIGWLMLSLIAEIVNDIPVEYKVEPFGDIWMVKRKRWFRWKIIGTFTSQQEAVKYIYENE